MFTPIHRALGIEPGPWQLSMLQAAVDQSISEDSDLDWKRQTYHASDPNSRDEVGKDVAAMANSGGGWIVFGVEEKAGRASGLAPVPWGEPEEQRLRQAIFTGTTPAVLGVEFHAAEVPDGGHIVGLRVPNSPDAPHFCRVKDDTTLRCPRRDGPHTVYMAERDIERAYRARQERRADWEERLTMLRADALDGIDFTGGVGAVAVAAPRETAPHVPLDSTSARRVLTAARAHRLYSEAFDYPCLPHSQTSPRTGYRLQRFSESAPDVPWMCGSALHHDGSVALAIGLGRLGLDKDRGADTAASQWVFKTVADFISLVVEHARFTRRSDTLGARFELMGPKPFFIEQGRAHPLGLQRRGELPPIYRFTPISFDIDPASPDKELFDLAQHVALDAVSHGGLDGLGLDALQRR